MTAPSSIDSMGRLQLACALHTSGARLHVTASFGVATLAGDDDAAHLPEKADHSLYRAKALGRNRVATQDDTRALLKRR